ncbi:uncharacterized protein NMK_1776 [Novimethylophilus kurashikiensis]|uniref:Uncharacterized protein n=1 Tax=Novimethylophilus kurashikiensis TaxID=1825523 RepID=A0A2R5FBY4_9PROT|nr:hypothetical protein [Novimethylophilus kurashikiensis]GBG14211.1 uncharacterized protein NMK_1776 [Novimethylophilus kurashikiensis]
MALENWRELLAECGNPELAVAIARSIEALWREDRHSLVVDASERHIAAELASHIRAQGLLSPDGEPWNVHVEYNRKGVKIKTVNGGEQVVIPDIILHRIGTDNNFLAIELKKGVSPTPDDDDIKKLLAYKQPHELNYVHALFLRLGVREMAGTVSCAIWA